MKRTVLLSGVAIVVLTAAALIPVALGHGQALRAVPATSPAPSEDSPSIDDHANAGKAPWASVRGAAPDELPLVAYWKLIWKAEAHENERWTDAAEVSRVRAKEDYLAQCMAEAGFTYTASYPGEPDPEWQAILAARQRDNLAIPALDADRAVVSAFGYGLMSPTQEIADRQLRAGKANPNTEYYNSLSKPDQRAYDRAMSGADLDKAPATPTTSSSDGCVWKAERTYPDPELASDGDQVGEAFFGLRYKLMEFGAEPGTATDKRVLALNTEWRTCMASAGVDVDARLASRQPDDPSSVDGPQAAFLLAMETGDDGAVADPSEPLSSRRRDQQSLSGSKPEVAIALADYDCRVATDYVDRLVAVQRSLEEAFITKNRSELDRLTTWVEEHMR